MAGPTPPEPTTSQTPRYFQLLMRVLRPIPDFDLRFIKPVRALAVKRLGLSPGARAIDAGCGPGGSLPFLRAAVGDDGAVIGVEISPTVAELARRRIARNGWSNVTVRVAPAQTVELEGLFDGLLMFAAPDSPSRTIPPCDSPAGRTAAWLGEGRIPR